MTDRIRLGPDLALPLDVVTESVGILAVKRAGKSHTAKLLVEQLHAAAQQVVIVDPKGDWWGIRSSADGKGPGLPIVIVGGEHADVPLEVSGGEVVARLVVEDRVSLLLDLSELRKHQVATFMTAFLETLYRLKAKDAYRTPLMLVVDEADAIAPQRPPKGEERMLGAAEDIVRRGGQRGIGITLVTQRAAVLNKNVLTQVGVLILLRTTGSQDIDAVDEWIKKHGQPEERAKVLATLATMPRGTAWVWAPGWPDVHGIFKQLVVNPIRTFDSGATPKAGETRRAPKTLADVDLAALQQRMAATIEKAKAEDPKELQRQVQVLQRELAAVRKAKAAPAPIGKTVEVPVLKDGQLARLERAIMAMKGIAQDLVAAPAAVQASAREIAAAVERAASSRPTSSLTRTGTSRLPVAAERVAAPRLVRDVGHDTARHGDLPSGQRAVLIAIAQHDDGVTREQLTILTGYKRSSRDSYLQRLGARGFIEIVGAIIRPTDAGVQALGADYAPLPVGDALRAHWLSRLPEGERRILELVCSVYPAGIPRDEVSSATDYKRSSRDSYLQRLSARRLVITGSGGTVLAAKELFG